MAKSGGERCPVCHKIFQDVAGHIWRVFDEPHQDWMAQHGIDIRLKLTQSSSGGAIQEIRDILAGGKTEVE